MTVENNVFVSGPGITSAVGFRSGHDGYVAVKTDAGIELQKSSGVVKYTKITQASFDRASYAYGEKMKLSLAAETMALLWPEKPCISERETEPWWLLLF